MKRFLICVLAIVMMLSSVAFANESAYINYEEKDADSITHNTANNITVVKTDALKVDATKNGPNSTIKLADDPKGVNGNVVQFTNPANADLDSSNKSIAYVNAFFQDEVAISATSGNAITGTKSHISSGFSFYAPAAVENETSDAYFNINLKYATAANNNMNLILWQIKGGKLYSYAESSLENKTIELDLEDKWYDLRFDIDIENKLVKTYIDSVLFYETFFPADKVEYVRYFNIFTVSDATLTKGQTVYFDNFFVNETPERLFEGDIKEIDTAEPHAYGVFEESTSYGTNINVNNNNSGTHVVEDGVLKITIPAGQKSGPSIGAQNNIAASSFNGYANDEYIYELDINFKDFNSEIRLGYFKYRYDNSTSDQNTSTPITVDKSGVLKLGTDTANLTPIAHLLKDTWYNFKFHYKPLNPTNDGSNSGLVADVYFNNELLAAGLVVSKYGNKKVVNVRNFNFQSTVANVEVEKERNIWVDNIKLAKVNKLEINPLEIVDVEVANTLGDLISSNYTEGNNTVTAYVSATSALKAGNVTVVAARYESANGQLLDVNAVPAVVSATGTLTKVTANLNVTNVQPNEFIKIIIVDSEDKLNPYTKPIILSSVQ